MERSTNLPQSSEADDRDAQLANIIDEMLERTSRGESLDLETELAKHPDLADDLRELWATARIAAAVASPNSGSASSDSDSSIFSLPHMFGNYMLLEVLGRGGMGIVFRAEHVSIKREVAIKMLLRGPYASSEDTERFTQEARSVAQLNHPNIVSIFEFGEHDGRIYYSMPIIDGETLAERIAKGPIAPKRAAKLMADVAGAVQHAHQHGVLHRDLKPSNILIDKDGQPHITDFGLARPQRESLSITKTGAVLGTPAFMSPEQAAGDNDAVREASDVYSLGSILYNMITGKPPFEAKTPIDLILMVIEQEPIQPRRVNGRIPKDLERITMRCLQKPTDLRYASADDLESDLRAFLRNESVAAAQVRLSRIVSRQFRATHHADVLYNWGGLWMLNGVALFVCALITQAMYSAGVNDPWRYFVLWTVGLGTWASIFWAARQSMGPVTFVERQIAHVWAAGLVVIFMLIPLERMMELKLFTMAPMLSAIVGVAFLVKAGSLTGKFYLQAILLFASSFLMAWRSELQFILFGVTAGLAFFIPGWSLYRGQARRERETPPETHKAGTESWGTDLR